MNPIAAAAHELTGAAGDFDALLDRVGEAGCVLLGESTHGTAEFYAVRAHITRRLIEEKGFSAVAVEADWPEAYRAGRWAEGADDDPDAAAALGDFTRFPGWVWRNREVVSFLQWLRGHNADHAGGQAVGFSGLDLSSPHPTADARRHTDQSARLARNAARHHRATARVGPEAWNVRERHMAETLDALRRRLGRDGRPGKVVVWAHNSHVGDARATEQAELGQLTLGQIVRDACGPRDAVLVGFSTFAGSVTAASDWGGPATVMRVEPASEDSVEALLHASGLPHLLLVMGEDDRAMAALASARLQRAIGALYRPQSERLSHYIFADVTRQFDVLVHLDTTTALVPLELGPDPPARQHGDLPENSPTGL